MGRLQGKSYHIGTEDAHGSVDFQGVATMPPMTGGPATITVPFTFSGALSYDSRTPNPQTVSLTGGGHVRLLLEPHVLDNTTWTIDRAEFEFD